MEESRGDLSATPAAHTAAPGFHIQACVKVRVLFDSSFCVRILEDVVSEVGHGFTSLLSSADPMPIYRYSMASSSRAHLSGMQ